jgi:hypothetical protein
MRRKNEGLKAPSQLATPAAAHLLRFAAPHFSVDCAALARPPRRNLIAAYFCAKKYATSLMGEPLRLVAMTSTDPKTNSQRTPQSN